MDMMDNVECAPEGSVMNTQLERVTSSQTKLTEMLETLIKRLEPILMQYDDDDKKESQSELVDEIAPLANCLRSIAMLTEYQIGRVARTIDRLSL